MATKKKSKAEVAAFVPSSPLGTAIIAGDVDAVYAVLDDVGREAWPTLRKEANAALAHVSQGEWGQLPGSENSYGFITSFSQAQRDAAARAVLVVGTAKEAADALQHKDIDETVAVLTRMQPAHLPELANVLVEHRWPNSDLAQRLITAGLSTRPTSEAYVLALIQWSGTVWHRQRKGDDVTFHSLVRSDPGLISEGVLLRLFDVEGTREVSLGIHDKYGKDDSWANVLIGLVNDGLLDRDVVIDKTLQAIERDWPQFRTSWYLGFLAALALTADERRAHAARFCGLLNSRIGPTVSVALDVVAALAKDRSIDDDTLLASLTPVMAARGKGQVKLALKLAAKAMNDTTRAPAQRLAIAALVNDDAEIQGLALDLVAAPRDADIEQELRDAMPLIVPRHRARAEAMIGVSTTTTTTAKATPTTTKAPPIDPMHESRRVGDVDLNDLVDVVARALEDDSDPAVVEQAFGGLIRFRAEVAAAPQAWAALRKRAPKITREISKTIGWLLLSLFDGELPDAIDVVTTSTAFFDARCHDNLKHLGGGLVPLATPTHRDGAVAADVLVDRLRAHIAAGVDVDALVAEGQLAIFRLGPTTSDTQTALRALPTTMFTRALRFAAGDTDIDSAAAEADVVSSPFGLAAYLRRHGPWSLSAPPTLQVEHRKSTDSDHVWVDAKVQTTPLRLTPHARAVRIVDVERKRFYSTFIGGDLAAVRHGLTLWPTSMEALFIDGLSAVANNLDWWGAEWGNRGHLEALLSPWVTCRSTTSLATSLLAVGLAGKEPGQTAVAVDALVKGFGDGRVAVEALGAVLSGLVDAGLVKGKRLAASLKAASSVDDAVAVDVRHLLERVLSGDAARAPRDVSALLTLLLHLRVDIGEALPAPTRAYLEALTGGGGVARDKKLLLA